MQHRGTTEKDSRSGRPLTVCGGVITPPVIRSDKDLCAGHYRSVLCPPGGGLPDTFFFCCHLKESVRGSKSWF